MLAEFNRDELIERLLIKSIILEAKNNLLESLVSASYMKQGVDVSQHLKEHLKKHLEIVFLSYPELDSALSKKIKDELDL
jgi:hypothetical protein